MKPHPRPPIIRKTIKWGGVVVTVLLVVVWVGSTSVSGGLPPLGNCGIVVKQGRAQIIVGVPLSELPREYLTERRGMLLAFQWDSLPRGAVLFVPVWAMVLVAMGTTCWAWVLDARARNELAVRMNLCPKCNYDRTGLAAGAVCPECGAATTSS